jgi:hypothetical protein
MVWECITVFGVGKLVRIDSTMNSDGYVDVIEKGLIPSCGKYGLAFHDAPFMQDNDPKHASKKSKRMAYGPKF